ncbi:type III secretion system HrpP C-terminal domain-containing protein [Pseudomonas sp. Pseu.R1]|uniref:type III secretion system HrpP C-terminal domain-containing protein n=1 Tax=Pseudomonas sp. Pseu.R1 TaxID=3379818 RepID=UPI003B966EBD
MNTPIKTTPRPVAQPAQRPVQAQSPAPADNRASLGGPRRGELDRLRTAWHQPSPNDALNADGLFFSQLLVPSVSEEPDHSGFGGSGLNLLPPGDGMPTQLIDELAERLPAQPDGPFNVTLIMPRLGEVQVNANKRDNQWNIELAFARRGVLKRLQPHQRACENALAEALGENVDLSFDEVLPA